MELHHEVRDLGADIEGLRHDLARVLSMFLVELSDWDEEAARNWILDRFSGALDDSFEEEV
ncbi:hypothetical protein IQ235_02745 [Oscillatoriales cyanobacterium LEGE 11467]|uniref:Uncharacterized protein n=1 Tax=Zarconia navalis LEGE 11467 TaxID=1828826 RepID=A0A928Z7I1_9CYAN|nr:hypothetical protein [Zarconia navalis]MBE9039713.1 hypothetical protein [Zarconia navalis LEGE 11467]